MNLARQNKSENLKAQNAIVVGGSIAGMLAARVLTEHFFRSQLLKQTKSPRKKIGSMGAAYQKARGGNTTRQF